MKLIRFWQAGEWVDIVIDDRIYTTGWWFRKSPLYTTLKSSSEFWVPLIEKAYAKLNYRSYNSLEGGFALQAMQDLSGCIPEFYFVEMKHETLFEIIYDAKSRQTMIGCGTYDEETWKKMKRENSLKISLKHAYAITAVKIVKEETDASEFKLIRIQDPHGVKASICYSDKIKKIYTKSNKFDQVTMESELPIQVDGESWILYEDFIYHFGRVDICNLTPNSIVGDIYTKSGSKKLSLSAKKGIFMGGTLSKVVEDDDLFVMKPQYRIVLTEPDEGRENDSICSILINLSLKNQRDYENSMDIELEIYVLAYDGIDENKLSKPFDDFRHRLSYNTFFTSISGIISKRLDLKLGTYYIVPSIKSDLQGTNFYLQIMSEQKNILE
ncbi:calpain-A-like [Aphidius gifuensis]|uniref:calpain-A-like n=1 Tax=Aphidius gifuensis TaxID=684658 RepID=UPI001CDD32EC|nr:calpain-A-like [Aphidius gifuensis]